VPLIANTLAVRAVIYDDRRGGYIDNVPATFTRSNNDVGIHYAGYPVSGSGACPNGLPSSTGFCVPPGSPSINNANFVGNDINPVSYLGTRIEALYKINDDWNVLLSQSYQDMNSTGVFYQQPNGSDGGALQPLQVTLFNPSFDNDRFESTAWTLNGQVGPLKLVYTGGYLVRNVEQVGDYTNYARGKYADYYQCYGPNSGAGNLQPTCFSPSAAWRSSERNEHQQHEIRLSTPDDWRTRAIGGVFWEANKLFDVTDWEYKTVPPCTSNGAAGTAGNTGCLSNVGTFPGTTVQNPGVQSNNTSFYQDQVRETKQTAVFGSIDFDIIPKVLIITAGTRYFSFKNTMAGSVMSSFDCFEGGLPPGGCMGGDSYNLNKDNLKATETGWKSRANLTWHVTTDIMLYYTYSQGFRPGGFNQNGGAQHATGPDGNPQYVIPSSYLPDKLTNNEIGWKSEFFDRRLQWNGAIYRESWDNVQIEFFDPDVVGNIFYDTNGQNFVIKGIETSLVARVMSGLTVQGAASWNQSRQTNSPALIDNFPGSVNFGKPITQVCNPTCAPITNPFGPIGSPSADSPPVQFSLRARYEWAFNGYAPYVQVGATHTGSSLTQAGANPTLGTGAITTSRLRFENPGYTTYDASIGVSKDAWWCNLYGQNLSNSNASTFISADQFIVAETPLRPRVLGVAVGYSF
jgi:iron complex outermembrane receptor protein